MDSDFLEGSHCGVSVCFCPRLQHSWEAVPGPGVRKGFQELKSLSHALPLGSREGSCHTSLALYYSHAELFDVARTWPCFLVSVCPCLCMTEATFLLKQLLYLLFYTGLYWFFSLSLIFFKLWFSCWNVVGFLLDFSVFLLVSFFLTWWHLAQSHMSPICLPAFDFSTLNWPFCVSIVLAFCFVFWERVDPHMALAGFRLAL